MVTVGGWLPVRRRAAFQPAHSAAESDVAHRLGSLTSLLGGALTRLSLTLDTQKYGMVGPPVASGLGMSRSLLHLRHR